MKTISKVVTVAVLLTTVFSQTTWAQTTDLETRLSQLEQELAILKRQIEINKEDAANKAKETPIITASAKDGFSFKSPDDSFKLKIRGLVQADSRTFTNNKKDLSGTGDNFLIRRARPIFEGTVGKYFDFYLMPDLANNSASNTLLVDAYADFKFDPKFKIRAGKFKSPFGLERLQSDAVANFIETGLVSNLVPNRDVGFQVFGDLYNESLSYAVAVSNGGADLASVDAADNNNDKDLVARIFAHPFKNTSIEGLKGLGLGVAGSYGHKEGSSTPTYRSPGQASVFSYASGVSADGQHTRLSPQAYYYNGSLGLLGEYAISNQKLVRVSGGSTIRDTFTNKAWQISGNYVLTGEVASFKGITPRNVFDLEKKTWGAFEVVGRLGQLKLDNNIFDSSFANLNTAINKEDAWGLGLNWYPHKNVRLSLDFEQTRFDRGAANNEDRLKENVFLTRVQLAY